MHGLDVYIRMYMTVYNIKINGDFLYLVYFSTSAV